MGKRITKKDLIKSIEELMAQYKLNKHTDSTYDCPLCRLYNSHKNYESSDCGKCLNTAFSSGEMDKFNTVPYGCIDRCSMYPNLSFHELEKDKRIENNKNIVEYYEKVLVLIKTSTIKEINKFEHEFRAKIIVIADMFM